MKACLENAARFGREIVQVKHSSRLDKIPNNPPDFLETELI